MRRGEICGNTQRKEITVHQLYLHAVRTFAMIFAECTVEDYLNYILYQSIKSNL